MITFYDDPDFNLVLDGEYLKLGIYLPYGNGAQETLTPAQARGLAAALVQAADAKEFPK